MNNIGVFGGTFDPIHNGHLYVAESARLAYNLAKVVFVPSYKPPHKKNKLISDKLHRFNMCDIATRDNAFFTVSRVEIDREEISYTYNTLELLQQENMNSKYSFIMGADMFADFPKWYKADKIIEKYDLIVFSREGYNLSEIIENEFYQNYQEKIHLLDLTKVNVSGTDLREQIREGYSVRYLTPDKVVEYIEKNNLYRGLTHE